MINVLPFHRPVENNGCPKVVAVDKSKLATDIELAT